MHGPYSSLLRCAPCRGLPSTMHQDHGSFASTRPCHFPANLFSYWPATSSSAICFSTMNSSDRLSLTIQAPWTDARRPATPRPRPPLPRPEIYLSFPLSHAPRLLEFLSHPCIPPTASYHAWVGKSITNCTMATCKRPSQPMHVGKQTIVSTNAMHPGHPPLPGTTSPLLRPR